MSVPERGEEDGAPRRRRGMRRWLGDRPRLVILLIGGIAMGGIVCMCLGVAAVAYWQR